MLITTVAPSDPQAPLQFAQLRELQAKFHSAGSVCCTDNRAHINKPSWQHAAMLSLARAAWRSTLLVASCLC